MAQFNNVGAEPTVVSVHGDLDISCREAFRRELDTASKGQATSLIVSLEDCTYCDCSAIGVLVSMRNTVGAGLKVIIPYDNYVRRTFNRLGLLDFLGVVPTVSAALLSRCAPRSSVEFACSGVA